VIAHALRNPLAEFALDDESPTRLLIIGPAPSGDLLEIVVLVFDDNRALAIHAMPMRKKYVQLVKGQT
jgi:hypothetical protein